MAKQGDEMGSQDKFLEQLRRAAVEIKRSLEAVQQVKESLQNAGEIAEITQRGFSALPADYLSRKDWALYASVWQSVEQSAAQVKPNPTVVSTFGATAYNAATTSSAVFFSYEVAALPNATVIVAARTQLGRVLDRDRLLENARASIRRLSLDRPSGGGTQTALTHLEASQRSIGSGEVPALVSMREAIETAVRQLIARRPGQEKGSSHKAKVISLGKHCGREGLQASDFEVLASIGHDLINKLSGSKDKVLTDPQVSDLLYQGLLHLIALLESFDEALLKPA